MTIWNHPPEFSEAFLAEHHHYVLVDAFHRIKAYLLYPCGCKSPCRCEDWRTQVLLSLNIELYNRIESQCQDQRPLSAMRHLLQIPDDRTLRLNLNKVYPSWLITEKLQEKETANHFRIVDQLVWTLLRLGATRKLPFFPYSPYASINEAIGIILGKSPLKLPSRKEGQEAPLCGEKGYTTHFKTYKALCHFIAAFKLVDPLGKSSCFSLIEPDQIEKFLKCSRKLRTRLLALGTRNSKEKTLFRPDSLVSLPDWVDGDDLPIPLGPFSDMH